jgi:tetratricopeptide (TPR) repeat protein
MMAGLAADGWGGYQDAIGFFTGLAGDTNCPPDLNVRAQFALGSAWMRSDSTDTNNLLANFQSATNVFGQICRLYPTNDLGALAWIEIGKCDLQLMNYDAATNAYAQVFNPNSTGNISARSQAQVGFGIALEKKAALASAADQTNLLQLALDNYLQVFDTWTGNNLRAGETADSFWVKKAGLQAADLVGTLGEWQQAVKIYSRLEGLLPQLKDSLDKKIAAAQEHLPPGQ